MNCLLSFIVPCYKVERYLSNCLDSILSCNLPIDNYEVLCIDDYSPDGSYDILLAYSELHSNIRIIRHTKNMGLGGARNTGIREAKGQYLWFVDSDDYVIGDNIMSLLSQCLSNNLDVLAFNYREVDEKGKILKEPMIFNRTDESDGHNFITNSFGGNFVNHLGYVWRFIYKVSYLQEYNLFFPEHVYWEDTVYMPKSIIAARRIQSVSDICYNYRKNESSISGKFHKQSSAELIGQMSFCAGKDLLLYSSEIIDEDLAYSIKEKAVHIINSFGLFLLRTSKIERKRFFNSLEQYDINTIKPYLKRLNYLFIIPSIGYYLTEIFALAYNIKHHQWRLK